MRDRLVAPSPSRCPFPTRHPSFRGVLPAGIPTVASHFDGHDLIVAFGAPLFLYHEFIDGDLCRIRSGSCAAGESSVLMSRAVPPASWLRESSRRDVEAAGLAPT